TIVDPAFAQVSQIRWFPRKLDPQVTAPTVRSRDEAVTDRPYPLSTTTAEHPPWSSHIRRFPPVLPEPRQGPRRVSAPGTQVTEPGSGNARSRSAYPVISSPARSTVRARKQETNGWSTWLPRYTLGLIFIRVRRPTLPPTTTSSNPSVGSAAGQIRMPPPYLSVLPTATSTASTVCGTPSRVSVYRRGRSRASSARTARS